MTTQQSDATKAVLAVMDLGNFNLATNKGFISEHRFIQDNERDRFGSQTVTIPRSEDSEEKDTYFMGIGNFEKEYNKAGKIYLPGLLYGLGKSFTNDKDLNLILGLPAKQISLKEKIINELQGKTFIFDLNGTERIFHFHKVGIVKEGFSAYYSLPDEKRKGRVTIIDIGGRTINIACFEDGKEVLSDTIALGTINYFERIASALQAQGKNVKVEDIRSYLENGIEISAYDNITSQFTREIVNELKLIRPQLEMDKIFLAGGGAQYILKDMLTYYNKTEKMDNALTANVDGNVKIGELKGWAKTQTETIV